MDKDDIDVDESSDEGLLLKSLAPEWDDAEKKIKIDTEAFRKQLQKLKDNRQELISIENEMMGLKVSGISHSLSFPELQKSIHESLLFTMNKMPTRIPLGVD